MHRQDLEPFLEQGELGGLLNHLCPCASALVALQKHFQGCSGAAACSRVGILQSMEARLSRKPGREALAEFILGGVSLFLFSAEAEGPVTLNGRRGGSGGWNSH